MSSRKNSIYSIRPYLDGKELVFDDHTVGLIKEPFVANADVILLGIAIGVLGKKVKKFTLVFSDKAFPGHHATLSLVRPEFGGNWYRHDQLGDGDEALGWLCPALFLYFNTAPKKIYLQVKE